MELLLEEHTGRIPVESSNVCYIAYDTGTAELQLAFYDGGSNEDDDFPRPSRMRDYPDEAWEECRIYRYTGVPAQVFTSLKNADSKGSYIYHNIAFIYPYERIQ